MQLLAFTTLAFASLVLANPTPTFEERELVPRAASSSFPTPPTTSHLSAPITIKAGQSFTPPKAFTRYDRGSGACEGQKEGGDKDAVFLLENGATLNNVVIGKDQAEGVHCLGSCTLNNVWFEDVCEDAITIKQTSGTSTIKGGGAKNAEDKIIQHNGGGTVVIDSFYANNFGKLYRSCGNCSKMYKRAVQISNVWAVKGSVLVGINSNYGDTATIKTTRAQSVSTICQKFTGNDSGAEPPKAGSGPDSTNCLYKTSDITTS